MPNSTSNSQKTMQNQSTSHTKENIKNKFVDKTEFTAAHVSPYGRLWVDHPFIETDWMHAHNHLEIGRCVKGSGTFNVDDKVLRVQAPCYSILYEGEWHSAQTNPYDQCEWNYLYIDLNYFLSRSSDDVLTRFTRFDWRNYDFPTIMQKSEFPEISALIDLIFYEASNPSENTDDVLTGLIVALVTMHRRTMREGKRRVADKVIMERISPAIAYIGAHYSEKITIEQLASICFTSVATLRRDFYAFSDLSPQEYLHKVRIKNTAVMLLTTSKSILEIANDCGYPTISCFNRQFYQAYGVSPREYRKKA